MEKTRIKRNGTWHVAVKDNDGDIVTVTDIMAKYKLTKGTILQRMKGAANFNEIINRKKRITQIDDKTRVVRCGPGGATKEFMVDGEWRSIKSIMLETGMDYRTVKNWIIKGKSFEGIAKRAEDRFYGVPDHIRIACESGSNKALLEA